MISFSGFIASTQTLQSSRVLAALFVCFLFLSYRLSKVGRRDPRMPPGPPTLPVIGNLHQIPITGIHKRFKDWAEQYGGVFSLKFGPSNMIVLADRKAIHELLDKKGSIYSERPFDYIASLVAHGDSFAFMDNTPKWRSQRKVASHNFSPRVLDGKVGAIQDAEIKVMMSDIIATPQDFYKHIQRTTSSAICSVVWSHRGPTFDSFWGSGVYKALDNYSQALEPGANPPVDAFCSLGMDAVWKEARRQADARREKGIKRNCILDEILDGERTLDVELSPNQLNHFLGVLVEGGADTTASSILTSLLYLAQYPEFQEKARKEIDLVCGPNRLPSWSDFDQLPYINCIIKEAMRIHPVLPVGVPHRVNKDDWYDGMLIPKDSMVAIPVWGLHFSEKSGYSEPENYNPDRFLNHPRLASEYAGSADWQTRDHFGYGAGRRICPGMHLAERTQWRVTARLLWAFDILKPDDLKTGKPIDLDIEKYREGLNHCPEPFNVTFKPRSQAHIDTILLEAKAAEEVTAIYE